jgi:hypothetical protein
MKHGRNTDQDADEPHPLRVSSVALFRARGIPAADPGTLADS